MFFLIILPVICFFFKFDIIFIFFYLGIVDFFRGRYIANKYFSKAHINTFYDNEGIIRYRSTSESYLAGLNELISFLPADLFKIPFSLIYSFVVSFSYYGFSHQDRMIDLGIWLTIINFFIYLLGKVSSIIQTIILKRTMD